MIRWSKIRSVARFELVCVLTSKSWLITTFGMPVFLLLYAGLVSIPAYLAGKKESRVAVYGVVDEAGVLALEQEVSRSSIEIPKEIESALKASGQQEVLNRQLAWFHNFVFRPFPTEGGARAALEEGRIRGYYRIPTGYLESGAIEEYSPEVADLMGSDSRRALGKLIVERLIEGKVPEEVSARVRTPIEDTKSWIVTAAGEVKQGGGAGKVVRLIVPIAFAILLLLSILMSAGGLIQATAVEKENKVVEVLLSSASPDEILSGKLVGLGIAGTLQMAVWFGMVAVSGIAFAGVLAGLGVELPWAGMALAVIYFPLAYLFYGSLMLGTGSIGSNQREANQWGMIWSFFAAIPMIFLNDMLHEPHGTIGRVMTWVPFSSPITVVMRLSMDPAGVAWWEIAGSIVVLIASIWVSIRLGARLFRVGILLTGARPKLRDIIRQARLS